jgi:hypothetical protein
VLALVGGLGLVAAFFMPWFSSQGLLLSGQFLHDFLGSATPSDLARFLPASSPSEVQLLRALVDLFPVAGGLAAVTALIGGPAHGGLARGGLARGGSGVANAILGLCGLVPLVGWAVGITQLPAGSSPAVGLWLIACASLAVLLGLGLELTVR